MKRFFYFFPLGLFFPLFVFAATPLPPVRTHWCYTLPLLRQRVECRLGLTEKALEEEYKKQYLPEECRAVRAKKPQAECVARYKALQPCGEKPVGEERTACAREIIGVTYLPERKSGCEANMANQIRQPCLVALRQKVYNLVKFRFYDLNERVEEFLQEHETIDGRPGIRFIVASELNKQRFNVVRTKAQRVQIIRQERTAWKQMLTALPLPDKRDFLDDAIADLSSVE